MALVTCRDCGAQISTKAKACPSCGKPRRKGLGVFSGTFLILFVCIVVGITVASVQRDQRVAAAPAPAAAPVASDPALAPRSEPPREATKDVHAKDFGERWPLTVMSGTVRCTFVDRPRRWELYRLTFETVSGRVYALNGIAEGYGAEPLDAIWRDDLANPGAKVSVRHLAEVAHAVCPDQPG